MPQGGQIAEVFASGRVSGQTAGKRKSFRTTEEGASRAGTVLDTRLDRHAADAKQR